ncbi:CRISPR-associated helicase Cas3' [Anaerococcus octavius]|uniref:CRISPR-associated helicase Cas3' n=1 Tax=Anaerococcus octavius TaxID=54007 RepID=UPI0023555E27|nr:CRISPR-associated helicase Cas3' [Anaerococcus octavius]
MESYKNLWAKKQETNGNFEWMPLYIHLSDSKNVSAMLWEHWLSDSQKNIVINSIENGDEFLAKNLVMFLGASHDLGKATPAFQIKKGFANSDDLDMILKEKLEQADFFEISYTHLSSINKSHHSLASEYLLYKYGVKEDIGAIVGAHHGKPVDSFTIIKNQAAYEANYYQEEKNTNPIYKKWEQVQKDIFDWALQASGFKSVSDLPEINQVGQVILTGLLIMADWIASNTKYFPLFSIYDSIDCNLEKRAEEGFTKWFKTELWQADYNFDYKESFNKRFGFYPNKHQERFIETILDTNDPGIFIFEAPMGMGKTEAALYGVELLAQKKGASGLFFALPTQATTNGIFPRVEKWLTDIVDDFDENLSLRLVHGKAYLNEDFQRIAKNINTDANYEDHPSVIVNEWFSGKKSAILDDFVVGTIDQFLLLSLKQKHLFLRHLGFSKKVVVIDEVHAYDAYMNQYLYQALKWMGAYNVPVIILSATLPAEKREELVKSYLSGKGIKPRKQKQDRQIAKDTYPLITYIDGSTIKYEDRFKRNFTMKIKVIREDEDNLINLISSLYKQGGNIGIIVNTVKKAQDLAKVVEENFGNDSFELIHSRFIDTHRIKKEEELLKQIGKNASRPDKKIYIGTQVIEQSLDIDFDIMITELAPIDLVLQRSGRLQRHNIKRSEYYKNPTLYITGTSGKLEFDEGSSFVYSSYLLARSQYFLPDEIIIPDDLSKLVQKVYSNEDIKLDKNLDSVYKNFRNEHLRLIERQKEKAKVFRIGNPDTDFLEDEGETIIGWLNNSNEVNTEEAAFAQVRDTKETIEVIALQENKNGIGLFADENDISENIDDYNISKLIAANTLKLPQILTENYNINKTINFLEKYNLEYLPKFQESAWLKGSLGIIFNENGFFEIGDYILKYSNKYGLSYERKGDSGKF